jgi:hypothetical protein
VTWPLYQRLPSVRAGGAGGLFALASPSPRIRRLVLVNLAARFTTSRAVIEWQQAGAAPD